MTASLEIREVSSKMRQWACAKEGKCCRGVEVVSMCSWSTSRIVPWTGHALFLKADLAAITTTHVLERTLKCVRKDKGTRDEDGLSPKSHRKHK